MKNRSAEPARCIMVQGTASHVGKSVLVAALCRIFHQDGFAVAPFKSQNMALNSFVTADGGEMGRAQVMQAEAAGVEHHTDMNPILLKPVADCDAQVILHGRPIGNLSAVDYDNLKARLLPEALGALERLRVKYDIVVLEGAGSPAEINLMATEIVNMRMAEAAEAPVLLVGDIDKGGVFASLVGTLELLPPDKQDRIAGFLINKFRGDVRLLEPGLEFLEERTGKPVLGVVHYLHQMGIDEEDSVPLEEMRSQSGPGGEVEIAVLLLPHISNFTDFDPLGREPGVALRYVRSVRELEKPDAVLIPGSKNTASDLQFLRNCGLAAAVVRLAEEGTPVLGICGGYQMLGTSIEDLEGVEGRRGEVPGLGLLPVRTRFHSEKLTCQVRAHASAEIPLLGLHPGDELRGYEIHMARSAADGPAPFIIGARGDGTCSDPDGCVSTSGTLLGTYIHGLFDNPAACRGLVDHLRARKGLAPLAAAALSPEEIKQANFDRLADAVRSSLDMDRIYTLLGLAQ